MKGKEWDVAGKAGGSAADAESDRWPVALQLGSNRTATAPAAAAAGWAASRLLIRLSTEPCGRIRTRLRWPLPRILHAVYTDAGGVECGGWREEEVAQLVEWRLDAAVAGEDAEWRGGEAKGSEAE